MLIQIRTRAVSCKQMTMVTPIQLLLFAARTVKADGEFIQLDSWSVALTTVHSCGFESRYEYELHNTTVPLSKKINIHTASQWHCAIVSSTSFVTRHMTYITRWFNTANHLFNQTFIPLCSLICPPCLQLMC